MFEYVCQVCGAVFERAENDYQTTHGCPWCDGDIERAERCEECGKVIQDSKAAYHRCDGCKKVTLQTFQAFLGGLLPGEIEYLQDYTDGRFWRDWRAWK